MQALKFIIGCGLSVTALALGACAQSSTGATSVAQLPAPAQPPPARDVQAVVDPSGSVERTLFAQSVKALADAVRTLPHTVPARAESTGQPSVHVGVRAIDGEAYAPDGLLTEGQIEAIPAVAAVPDASDGDITPAVIAIGRQRKAARAAYASASAAATRLAAQITRLDPPVAGCSDVWGAVSAAAQSFTALDRRLIVVSDMAVHCRSNMAGSLGGAHVLIVHICRTAAVCDDQERYWQRALKDRGAANVEFVRFERMRERIRTYVQEVMGA